MRNVTSSRADPLGSAGSAANVFGAAILRFGMPDTSDQPEAGEPDPPKFWWILATVSMVAMVPCVGIAMVPILGLLALPAIPMLVGCSVYFLHKAGVAADLHVAFRLLALTVALVALVAGLFQVALEAHWTVLQISRGESAPPLLASVFSVWRLLLPLPAAALIGRGFKPHVPATLCVYCILFLLSPMTALAMRILGEIVPFTA